MNTDSWSIAGKVALVTGSSRGIGQAIAELFAERDAEVIVSSRKQESVDEVAAAIRARGGKAHAIAAHVGKLEEIERLLARLGERNLAVDILVNNAGISPPVTGAFCDTTPALWDKIMEVNLRGPFFLTAAIAKQMIARGKGGSIVNISTTSARMAQPEIGAYCVSKAALDAMTRVFARAEASSYTTGETMQVNGGVLS